jgi:hypothetical protein
MLSHLTVDRRVAMGAIEDALAAAGKAIGARGTDGEIREAAAGLDETLNPFLLKREDI